MDKPTTTAPAALQETIWRSQLPRSEKYVLLAMARCSDAGVYRMREGTFYLTYITGCSRPTVEEAIKRLVGRGAVTPIDTGRYEGKFGALAYRINSDVLTALPPYSRTVGRLINPGKTRKRLIAESDATCAYCKQVGDSKRGPDGKTWTVDRVIPRALGGRYEAGNIVLACDTCNRKKREKETL